MKSTSACTCLVGVALFASGALFAQITGPSSSQRPYVLPVAPGAVTVSILTVGDSVNYKPDGVTPYRMVGLPDGLGAMDNGDGTLTLFMNHELTATDGIARAHGATGAFVSRWTIDALTFGVTHGDDLIQSVQIWNDTTAAYGPSAAERFGRFCSATLAEPEALYNSISGLGTTERVFFNGEENGTNGQAFAHVASGVGAGVTWELPWCGRMNFENNAPAPYSSDLTVVIGTDDSSTGQLYVYVGTKSASGSDVERAGLTHGTLYGLVVDGVASEDPATGIGAISRPFSLHNFGDVSAWSGATLQTQSRANGVTEFLRPEDGHWDAAHSGHFYWVTTGANGGPGRLWRLRFSDMSNPALGGVIENLLDGSEGIDSPDNICVRAGYVMIQEDAANAILARVWRYDILNDKLFVAAQANPDFFQPGGVDYMGDGEEVSGIIDLAAIVGPGWFAFDIQTGNALADPELVDDGQLLALYAPQAAFARGDANCDGSVNGFDVEAFVLALSDPPAYAAAYPDCNIEFCDVNGDGSANGFDVDAFVGVLTGP
ncbi:MAG: hypothetical protein CHACPFDD_04148 [Phycisphaerae bacterium]|nr:hypothetical protein [Phycisphaerae bacterium]